MTARNAVDFTFQGASSHTLAARDSVDFSFGPDGGLLSAHSPLGEASGVGTSYGVTGTLRAVLREASGLASVLNVVTGDLRTGSPLGEAQAVGSVITTGALRVGQQAVAAVGAIVSKGLLQADSPIAEAIGYALHAPSIDAIRGQTVTRYRAILRAAGFSDLTLLISSFQARARYGDQSYLSVVIPNAGPLASAISDRASGELSIEAGATVGGQTFWAELLRATLDRVRSDKGPRSYSITINGYALNAYLPTARTVAPGNYDRIDGAGRSYRLPDVDFSVRPGDQVTLPDSTDLIVGAISYSVNARTAAMELQALTDADKLATLPW